MDLVCTLGATVGSARGTSLKNTDDGIEYNMVDMITRNVPTKNFLRGLKVDRNSNECSVKQQLNTYMLGTKSCSTKKASSEETTIEMAVANPLRILSAYFITEATTKPPNA